MSFAMKVETTSLAGAYRIVPQVHSDTRGEFWRSFCQRNLARNGLEFEVCQSNVSVNPQRHTLRGFHYQRTPSHEEKILTLMTGAVHLVIVDIRPDSPTFLAHEAFRFEVGDRSSFLVPHGCATGFLTLTRDTTVHYQMSDYYQPEYYTGFHYNDPSIGVVWPIEPEVVSERDQGFLPLDVSSL